MFSVFLVIFVIIPAILHLMLSPSGRGLSTGKTRWDKNWTTESKDLGYTLSSKSVRVHNSKHAKSHSRTYKTIVWDKPKGVK